MDGELLTVGQVARLWGVCEDHARSLIDQGLVPSIRTGRGMRLVPRGAALLLELKRVRAPGPSARAVLAGPTETL